MYAMHMDHYHSFSSLYTVFMRCWDFEVRFYAYKSGALCTKLSLQPWMEMVFMKLYFIDTGAQGQNGSNVEENQWLVARE